MSGYGFLTVLAKGATLAAILFAASSRVEAQANVVGPIYCSNNCGVATPGPDLATAFELDIAARGKPAGLTYRICNAATRRCAEYQKSFDGEWNGNQIADMSGSPSGGIGDGGGGSTGTGGNWGGVGVGAGTCYGQGCFGSVGTVRPVRPH